MIYLIKQNNEVAGGKPSSSRVSTVAVKGFLNYKATHHEGKVHYVKMLHLTLTFGTNNN